MRKIFLKKYIRLHYGEENSELEKAWNILADEIYIKDSIGSSFESAYIACPSLQVDRVANCGERASSEYPTALLQAAELYTSEYEKFKSSESFCFDYVDLVRQLSANYAWGLVYAIQKAYQEKNSVEFRVVADKFLKLIDLQGKLLLFRRTCRIYGYFQA